MFIWIIIAVLLVAAAIFFAVDPRRLRVGILILAALSLTALAIIAMILDKLSSPTNEAAAWFLLGIITVGLVTIVALAAFLIYTGIIMLLREARRLPNLLSLLAGLGLLGYVALGFIALRFNSQTLMLWIIFSIPPLGYLGFVFASFLLYAWIYARWVRRSGAPAAAVIVLGAGLDGDRVTPLLASRLSLGKETYERSRAADCRTKMIVSGGKGVDESVSEAEAMSGWLVGAGVPEADVVLEDQSTTTEENLRRSIEVLECQDIEGPAAVVTNDFHAFRAANLMSRLRMPGYAIGSRTARYYWPTATIREFIALLRDHHRLNTVILGALSIPLLALIFVTIFR